MLERAYLPSMRSLHPHQPNPTSASAGAHFSQLRVQQSGLSCREQSSCAASLLVACLFQRGNASPMPSDAHDAHVTRPWQAYLCTRALPMCLHPLAVMPHTVRSDVSCYLAKLTLLLMGKYAWIIATSLH